MAGGIEHDPDALAVTVWWLPRRFGAASLECGGDSDVEVVDLNLEVEHLRLLTPPLRPRRRLVPPLALDVDVHTACGIPELRPMRRIEIADLEPQEAFVEAGDRPRVGAVDGDADPSNGRRPAHITQSARNRPHEPAIAGSVGFARWPVWDLPAGAAFDHVRTDPVNWWKRSRLAVRVDLQAAEVSVPNEQDEAALGRASLREHLGLAGCQRALQSDQAGRSSVHPKVDRSAPAVAPLLSLSPLDLREKILRLGERLIDDRPEKRPLSIGQEPPRKISRGGFRFGHHAILAREIGFCRDCRLKGCPPCAERPPTPHHTTLAVGVHRTLSVSGRRRGATRHQPAVRGSAAGRSRDALWDGSAHAYVPIASGLGQRPERLICASRERDVF